MNLFLYHYYKKARGPFLSLSDISDEEANKLLNSFKEEDDSFIHRDVGFNGQYMFYRRLVEDKIRSIFVEKGGKPIRKAPYYTIMSNQPRAEYAYGYECLIEIPIEEIDMSAVSFTYGDSMMSFAPTDKCTAEYRQTAYTYDEIVKVIAKYGWPVWPEDAVGGPGGSWWIPAYVEAQVWYDDVLKRN